MLVFWRTGRPCLLNRISCSCFGESRLNGWPADLWASTSSSARRLAISPLCFFSRSRSTSTPRCSISSSTGTSGCSISSYIASSAGSFSSAACRTWCSCSVTSASSAAYSAAALDRHLVERDLLRALAGDVLVLDRVDAEVELRAGVHVVARRGRVQHVGLEHRVVAHARELDAAALQHVRVVLEVMPDLRALWRPRAAASASRASSPGRAGPARRRSRARAGGTRPCRARCRTRRRRSRPACSRGWSFRCRRRRVGGLSSALIQ